MLFHLLQTDVAAALADSLEGAQPAVETIAALKARGCLLRSAARLLGQAGSSRLSLPSLGPPQPWAFHLMLCPLGQLFIISFSTVFLRHGSYERCYTE